MSYTAEWILYINAHGRIHAGHHEIQINKDTWVPTCDLLSKFTQINQPLKIYIFACYVGQVAHDLSQVGSLLPDKTFVGIFGPNNGSTRLEVSANLILKSLQLLDLPSDQHFWSSVTIDSCYFAKTDAANGLCRTVCIPSPLGSETCITDEASLLEHRLKQSVQYNDFLGIKAVNSNDPAFSSAAALQRYKDYWFMHIVTALTNGTKDQKEKVGQYLTTVDAALLQHKMSLACKPSRNLKDYFEAWDDQETLKLLQPAYASLLNTMS